MARPVIHSRSEALTRALALFWRKGFHATSLKDLEAALEMRPGSIYLAFGSKEGLFREALARYAADTMAELEAALAAAPDALTGLAVFVRGLGRLRAMGLPACACMLARAVVELNEDQPEARAETERLMAQMEDGLRAAYEAAAGAGILAPGADPALLAAQLQSQILGLRVYAQRDGGAVDPMRLAEALAAGVEAQRAPAAVAG